MADDASKVRVGVTGEVYNAPSGTTMPTTPTATLNVAFKGLGYLSEDGITMSVSTDTTDIKAWQNGDVVRKIQTGSDVTFGFTAIELNPVSLAAAFGNYTATDTSQGQVNITGNALATQTWVIDAVDGLARVRIVIPLGQPILDGDMPIGSSDPISLPMTITAYPWLGVKALMYLDHDITVSS